MVLFHALAAVVGVYVACILGFMVLTSLLLIGVSCWERRMIWPYGGLEEQPRYDAATGYGARSAAAAVQAGCTLLGWAPDLKGEKYQVSYGMLVTPERDCLIVIGAGTIFGLALAGTSIYSQSADGRWFYSTDNQAGITIDVSRMWLSRLSATPDFSDLLRGHRAWMQSKSPRLQLFEPGQEAQTFRAARESHYERLGKRGLIAFIDDTGIYWRYTLLGATLVAPLGYVIGMIRAMTKGRFPQTA